VENTRASDAWKPDAHKSLERLRGIVIASSRQRARADGQITGMIRLPVFSLANAPAKGFHANIAAPNRGLVMDFSGPRLLDHGATSAHDSRHVVKSRRPWLVAQVVSRDCRSRRHGNSARSLSIGRARCTRVGEAVVIRSTGHLRGGVVEFHAVRVGVAVLTFCRKSGVAAMATPERMQ